VVRLSELNLLELGSTDFSAAEEWCATKMQAFHVAGDSGQTVDRRGLQDQPAPCFVCLQEEDAMEHLFTQYVHARQVRLICFTDMGVVATPPTVTCKLEDWWLRERRERILMC
jgi:hypothetical protein